MRHYHPTQQSIDEQEQQQQPAVTDIESNGVRSATAPQLIKTPNDRTRIETDQSSVASFDFAHADLVDMPGSWRYHSVPVRTVTRRIRGPIPQSFLDAQHYASDSEQIIRSSSYHQQPFFGSIPTING